MTAHLYLKQIQEKLHDLAAQTDEVKKSAEFQQYLDTMAKFWEYSHHNRRLYKIERQPIEMFLISTEIKLQWRM